LLILLFSASLFWLLLEMRTLTTTLQEHIQKDVRSIIDLSSQLQSLENLNADYILIFLPGRTMEKILRLERSRLQYAENWMRLKKRLQMEQNPFLKTNDFWNLLYRNVFYTENSVPDSSLSQKVETLIAAVDNDWLKVNNELKQSVQAIRRGNLSKSRYLRDTYVKHALQTLRTDLTRLNRLIGQKSVARSHWMTAIVRKAQAVIWATEISLLLIALLVAFFVAGKITRPVEALKEATQRLAIHDFNVSIARKSNDEIGELSRAFEQLSLRLKESDRFKTAMLSQFTHEMKSPLGSIKQATQLLENSLKAQLDPTQARFLNIIKGNYNTLQRLITNILHTAAYDIGRIQLKYQTVNLVKLITGELIYLSPVIKEKEIKVNINFSAKKIECELDAEKFKEVVQNLITNAVKFSPAGTEIDVSVKGKFPLIFLKIKDRGIGIPEKEIPYIFEKMYRASNSEKISVKGTGLGLYIVSQIIRAHGGRIRVKSEINKGTEFTVTLPVNRHVAREGGWLDDA